MMMRRFLPEVERSGLLAVDQQLPLRRFLQQCDLVKFAGQQPDAEFKEIQ